MYKIIILFRILKSKENKFMSKQLIECVPNFSEGIDMKIIDSITDQIKSVEGVKLLDVDPGKATNRTVVTFVGEPIFVIEAAFKAMKRASELIDMSKHSGEHPRMGATDVCPLIPIANISMDELVVWANKLGKRVVEELDFPIFLYEKAATTDERKNLATIRAGEYEGMQEKLKDPKWKPDYGNAVFNAKAGATAIGVRDFLVAYNVNLNTSSVRRANAIAFDVREKGRLKREGDKLNGKVLLDENGEELRSEGMCKSVKAIGWYIEEYGLAQISMNLTDINITSLHAAYEACYLSANNRGLRVTGSELVGLVPKKVLIDAGKYFLNKQNRSLGISDSEIMHIAIKSLGLDELAPFDPKKKVIEYLLEDEEVKLVDMNLIAFSDETASESVAPGGGSISAYVGTLGISLATMVANISSHKRGWDDRWEYFSNIAVIGQDIRMRLINLVDEDTNAFNKIITAVRLPKKTEEDKKRRSVAISDATKYAIEIPLLVMKTCLESFDVCKKMVEKGNINSVSDAAVGSICTLAAIKGAYLNVKINCDGFDDIDFVKSSIKKADEIMKLAVINDKEISDIVLTKIN